MKIENVDISRLKAYERNNKTHTDKQIEHIAKSIKEFGFLQPVVVDKNNVIVVGHARVKALKLLGELFVDVVRVDDLNEDQIKAYRILDNKLSSDGAFDFDNIIADIEGLTSDGFITDFALDEWVAGNSEEVDFSSVDELGDIAEDLKQVLKLEVDDAVRCKKIITKALEDNEMFFKWSK
jgi:hypothetical protein